MSLFKSIAGAIAPIAGSFLGGPIGGALGTAIGGILAPQTVPRPAMPRTPGFQAGLPILPGAGAVGRVARSPVIRRGGAEAAGFLGDAAQSLFGSDECPKGFHLDKKTRSKCVRNRRMNPMNPRAFRRATRRIKGAKKFAAEVEKVIPKRTRARAAPRGHHQHLHHN